MFLGIAEDAQGDEFLGDPLGVGWFIIRFDCGQHGQAGPDLADGFIGDIDTRFGNTLDDANHVRGSAKV